MFEDYPDYFLYRTLKLTSPRFQGEDVYALQTALVDMGMLASFDVCDGILGPQTSEAIKRAQEKLRATDAVIVVDGAAGGVTQTAITRLICENHRIKYKLPKGLPFGQCMHESSCRVGSYSPVHYNDIGYDAGVAQRNTIFTPAKEGFNVPASIDTLGANLRKFYDKFAGLEHERRRWELAAGSWNAPAFACFIAREEGASGVSRRECAQPGHNARTTLERYMASATAYL
jgi:peptidoglycan hydrolase-like protein with peptidoglycan-binding domain